jgi:hypothetical protein
MNATAEQLDELDRLSRNLAETTDWWSDYYQADVPAAQGAVPPSSWPR